MKKKRYLLLGGLGLWGAILVVIYVQGYEALMKIVHSVEDEAVPSARAHEGHTRDELKLSRPLRPLPDVDTLAKRLPYNQPVYIAIRDEALADYAKAHPGPNPANDEAVATLKLMAYLAVWDDFYCEGLWETAFGHAKHLENTGQKDQVWRTLQNINWYSDRRSATDSDVLELNTSTNTFSKEGWPAAFRLIACQTALNNMISAKNDETIQPPISAEPLQELPRFADEAVGCYRELIRAHVPHAYLFRAGDALLDAVSKDEPTLQRISKGLDDAFAAEDRDNPQATVLDGVFYLDDAWNARGNGYANTVTDKGWQLFRERLERADSILQDAYTKNPHEPGIARCMMTAVLGEEKPRDEMEKWFQRGQDVDGNLFSLYMSKRWYLLPRWYGSDEDVWQFGLECAQSKNWQFKIPIALVECISDRADREPNIYSQADVWQPVEKAFRDYLDHYPDSVHYRSLFALSAAQGRHWDVAKEQFKILGNNWDLEVFPGDLYQETTREVAAH